MFILSLTLIISVLHSTIATIVLWDIGRLSTDQSPLQLDTAKVNNESMDLKSSLLNLMVTYCLCNLTIEANTLEYSHLIDKSFHYVNSMCEEGEEELRRLIWAYRNQTQYCEISDIKVALASTSEYETKNLIPLHSSTSVVTETAVPM